MQIYHSLFILFYENIAQFRNCLEKCHFNLPLRDVRGAKKIAPHRTATFTPLHRTAPHRNYSKISHTAPHRTAALQKFRTPHRTAPQKFLKIAHCTAPHRTAPHRTTPHRTAPQCTALYSTKMLLRTRLHKV